MSTEKNERKIRSHRSARQVLEKMVGPLNLGEVLRSERLCEEMTLKEFSALLGISIQHLSDIENGRRFISHERAAEFARILKQSVPLFVQLALEDSMRRSKLKLKITVDAA